MASSTIYDFLESSTIHGLSHISRATSKAAKAAWIAILVACFSMAIYMITGSYKEWQESPVSTTITTHPISELEFPTVTVCPPRRSNTALNHLLEKVKDVNFTEGERNRLVDISREVFLEIPNKEMYDNHVTDQLLSVDNMRSVAKGKATMPKVDNNGLITIESSELEGSFQTPGSDDSKYQGNKPQSLHYVLKFPKKLKDVVGKGALVISVQTKHHWIYMLAEKRFQLHNNTMMNWHNAEEYCVSQGGHLASIASEEQNHEVFQVTKGKYVWLGGNRKELGKSWHWSDNST